QSNGRVESDLLDRLHDRLASTSEGNTTTAASSSPANTETTHASASPAPEISAPVPQFPGSSGMSIPSNSRDKENIDAGLEQEARGLEQLVQNQSRPTNLIAV